MARVACRVALLVSLVLAIVSLARPAFATPAPLCDDRGATALASPPALDARDVAIDRVRAASSCPFPADEALPLGARVSGSHLTVEQTVASADRALPLAAVVLPAPAGVELPPVAFVLRADRGVRYRVERPPRG